jgi:hypothetical protein
MGTEGGNSQGLVKMGSSLYIDKKCHEKKPGRIEERGKAKEDASGKKRKHEAFEDPIKRKNKGVQRTGIK